MLKQTNRQPTYWHLLFKMKHRAAIVRTVVGMATDFGKDENLQVYTYGWTLFINITCTHKEPCSNRENHDFGQKNSRSSETTHISIRKNHNIKQRFERKHCWTYHILLVSKHQKYTVKHKRVIDYSLKEIRSQQVRTDIAKNLIVQRYPVVKDINLELCSGSPDSLSIQWINHVNLQIKQIMRKVFISRKQTSSVYYK